MVPDAPWRAAQMSPNVVHASLTWQSVFSAARRYRLTFNRPDDARPKVNTMRFLPTRIHAVFDYVLGVVLAIFPSVTSLHQGGLIEWGPTVLGAILILYSMLTNYEMSVLRLISIKLHLVLDAVGGVALIALAVVDGSSRAIWLPLLVLGMIEIGSSLVTRTVTSDGPGLDSPPVMASTRRSKVAMPIADGPKTSGGRPNYSGEPDTNERLRASIDSGRTGDKVAMTDPAMAPLGSDDEAGDLHDEKGLATARQAGRR